MAKIIPFPKRPGSDKPIRTMVIEIGELASDALDKCAEAEDLNATTAFNRGVIFYADMVEVLKTLQPGEVISLELPQMPDETFLIARKAPKRRWLNR